MQIACPPRRIVNTRQEPNAMLTQRARTLPVSAVLSFMIVVFLSCAGCDSTPGVAATPTLTDADVTRILDQAAAAASAQPSLLRVNAAGEKQTTRMHIMVLNRSMRTEGRRSMPDAWNGSVSIATMKAYTAIAFSSNQNALTTRTIGTLSQPGGPLWNIGNSNRGLLQPGLIEFPGGVP